MTGPDSNAAEPLEAILRGHPFLATLGPEQVGSLLGCARHCEFAAGEYVWRQGERADYFYLIRSGQVALEIFVPNQGPLPVEMIGEGDVLGWSCLIEPFRSRFDARVVVPMVAVGLDGNCLRNKAEEDHDLGYRLLMRLAGVIAERLEATRVKLLDQYTA